MEEIKRVKNASEAKALKEQKAMSTEGILTIISANVGVGSLAVPGFVSTATITELMKLGFSISYKTNIIGDDLIKIEW